MSGQRLRAYLQEEKPSGSISIARALTMMSFCVTLSFQVDRWGEIQALARDTARMPDRQQYVSNEGL